MPLFIHVHPLTLEIFQTRVKSRKPCFSFRNQTNITDDYGNVVYVVIITCHSRIQGIFNSFRIMGANNNNSSKVAPAKALAAHHPSQLIWGKGGRKKARLLEKWKWKVLVIDMRLLYMIPYIWPGRQFSQFTVFVV